YGVIKSLRQENLPMINRETLDAIVLYKYIAIGHMKINPDWVMDAVQKWLRRNVRGRWVIEISRPFTFDELHTGLGTDFE
ncbi:hypothetical protein PENTCL1PPCAC_20810, partial [Pristionchus entomophagus]